MICQHCGSEITSGLSYEDGGGDFGELFTELWHCQECGQISYGNDVGIDGLMVNIVDDSQLDEPDCPGHEEVEYWFDAETSEDYSENDDWIDFPF